VDARWSGSASERWRLLWFSFVCLMPSYSKTTRDQVFFRRSLSSKKCHIFKSEHCTNDQRAAEFEPVSRQPDKLRNLTLICKSSTPNAENTRNQGAGSGAQGAETGEVRVQEEAIRLQRGLLQRREEQIKFKPTASRSSET
jgi:hypothetical protein